MNEVETILSEIRERVRAHEVDSPSRMESENGFAVEPTTSSASKELARLEAHLTATARAWDRLPPVNSERSGAMARLELSLKARLKSLSRWFTWEQVNFNAAVHHALSESLAALKTQERQLLGLQAELEEAKIAIRSEAQNTNAMRAELRDSTISLRAELQSSRAELQRSLAESQRSLAESESSLAESQRSLAESERSRAEFQRSTDKLRAEFEEAGRSFRAELDQAILSLRDDLTKASNDALTKALNETLTEARDANEALRSDHDTSNEKIRTEMNTAQASLSTNISSMHDELVHTREDLLASIQARAAEAHLQISTLAKDLHDEQAVCFKQLSLEASEAAALEDRGRRALIARLEKLEDKQ